MIAKPQSRSVREDPLAVVERRLPSVVRRLEDSYPGCRCLDSLTFEELDELCLDKERVRAVLDEAIRQKEEGKEEKPYFSYSRNTSWNYEPCAFCKRDKLIHLVHGRYIYAEMGEDGEYIEGTQVYFCGDCNELLSRMVKEMYE